MAVSDKIKALLQLRGKRSLDLAEYFEISPQSMRNKFARSSFSAEDLIKVAEYLDCRICFELNDNQKIYLEAADISEKE